MQTININNNPAGINKPSILGKIATKTPNLLTSNNATNNNNNLNASGNLQLNNLNASVMYAG